MKRATLALPLLLLAACSATPATTTPSAPPIQPAASVAPTSMPEPVGEPEPEEVKDPRNPMDLLEQADLDGCETDARAGEVDIYGNRYVTCDFMDNGGTPGTSFSVRTYPGNPAEWDPNWPLMSTDSARYIGGDDFIASFVGDWSSYSKRWTDAELEKVATKLGGDYAKPGDEVPYRP